MKKNPMEHFLFDRRLVEARFDTRQQVGQVRLGHRVVHVSTLPFGPQEPAALHEPQMLGGHVAKDSTGFGQLADGVLPPQEHLHHP
jgi:hypothetical protein